eukprot:CAMPEP_0113593408 /NCGR_PEP_ID=MMETSP0015_2-20120614/38421_1 /TAXON_ID=2838 /ORGANISM="Odontella" /LENGTH=42 /DNA_ID=CAMNT_0000500123 /DNA_START=30 /DNA_END=154 /DNA_ORIENTATION=+ /assembly_acc=CAM_ASM_000160
MSPRQEAAPQVEDDCDLSYILCEMRTVRSRERRCDRASYAKT